MIALWLLVCVLRTVCPGHYTHEDTVASRWATFQHMIQYDAHAILKYYVIVMEPGAQAVIHCDSSSTTPQIILIGGGDDNITPTTPQKPKILGIDDFTKVSGPCTLTGMLSTRYDEEVYTCYYTVNYTVHEQWWDCRIWEFKQNHIRFVTIPETVPYQYKKIPVTNHMDWWCLRDRNRTYVDAGHLLWLHWAPSDHDHRRAFQSVERLSVWELEPGDFFECNGTNWEWGSEFSCLKILPSGWPALVHCHGMEKGFVILGILLTFMFVYMNGMAAHKVYKNIRRWLDDIVKKKFKKYHTTVPLIKKDKKRPYINMPNIGILVTPKAKPDTVTASSGPFSFEFAL